MNFAKKNKYYVAVLLSALVLLLGIIFLIKYNSPIEKFKREVEKSDYVSAVGLYHTKLVSTNKGLRAIAFMKNELDVILQEFKNRKRDYQSVTAELDAFSVIPEISGDVDDIRANVEYYQRSFNAYATAEEFLAKEDYKSAIEWYRGVVADDSKFQDAQQKMETCVTYYRDAVVEQVDGLTAEEKYADANTVMTEAMGILPNDTILTQKWNSILADQEEFLIQQELEEIDQLLYAKNYAEAVRVAAEAFKLYGDNPQIYGRYAEAIETYEYDISDQVDKLLTEKNLEEAQKKINELSVLLPECAMFYTLSDRIKKYYPVRLSDIKITEVEALERKIMEYPKDLRGNTYEWGIVYYRNGASGRDIIWELYLLNKEYKRFTATLVPSEKMEKNRRSDSVFKIYVDNGSGEMEIFSTEINIYSEPIDIDLDITGADRLRIEFGGLANYLLAKPELVVESLN